MDVSVSGTIDEKTYLKKYRGASAPQILSVGPVANENQFELRVFVTSSLIMYSFSNGNR